jgi:hypothetical protein
MVDPEKCQFGAMAASEPESFSIVAEQRTKTPLI